MNPRALYRTAAVLILLFVMGHLASFPWSDPAWGVDLSAMQSAHFRVLGFNRTYWNFYVGFGLIEGVFLLAAAVIAWQFGGLPPEMLARLRGAAWALALCFAALGVLSWMYFFTIPIVFSCLITLCLVVAASVSGQRVVF